VKRYRTPWDLQVLEFVEVRKQFFVSQLYNLPSPSLAKNRKSGPNKKGSYPSKNVRYLLSGEIAKIWEVSQVSPQSRIKAVRSIVSLVHPWIYFDEPGAAKPAARKAASPEGDIKYFTKARAASGDLLVLSTTAA